MNIQSWIILAIVAACVILAVHIYRKKGSTCSCDCGCGGCSKGSGCPSKKSKK